MEITVYGIIFIPLLIILFFFSPKYLIYLLLLTLTLQITSLINIYDYSLQIYRFITILLTIRFFISISIKNGILTLYDRNVKGILFSGACFTLFSFIWSFVSPVIFSGYPVYPPQYGIDFSAIYGPSPLKFSYYNVAFSFYILFYFFSLVYISTVNWEIKDLIIIKNLFIVCISIVILCSLSQVLSYLFGTFDITKLLFTITTKKFSYTFIGDILPMPKIQATFLEPSMLSPFIVGAYSYYLYINFFKNHFLNFFIISLIFLIILLTTSTTAYIALLVMSIFVLFHLNIFKLYNRFIYFNIKNIFLFIFRFILLLIIIFVVLLNFIGLNKFIDLVNLTVVNKPNTSSYNDRTTADLHALKIFLDTYGLGVGLGSNRPSSLLPYLLSQVGLIGTILFFSFIIKIYFYSSNSLKRTKFFSFFFLLPSVLISQLLSYPDITNPTLWQFIYFTIIISIIVRRYDALH